LGAISCRRQLRNHIGESAEQIVVSDDIDNALVLPAHEFKVAPLRWGEILVPPRDDDATGICVASSTFGQSASEKMRDFDLLRGPADGVK